MPKQISVLALVRDIGAGNVVGPTLQELRQRGHKTMLLVEAEGKARERVSEKVVVVSSKDDIDAKVAACAPDVLISGLSSPRVLEHMFDLLAIDQGIPLAQFEDYWGCHVRSKVEADLYVTVDVVAEHLVKEKHPHASVVVAGFAGIAPAAPSIELQQAMTTLHASSRKVLVYPDGGPECEFALPLLVESVLLTKQNMLLAPKIHPKFKSVVHPSGAGTWDDWCQEQLQPLKERGRVLYCSQSTDEVVEAADGVVSGYSSTLMRPARKGQIALTLWDEVIQKQLKESTGLDQTPLMLDGRYPLLREVQPLDDILSQQYPKYDLKPFDAKVAADAVLSLV